LRIRFRVVATALAAFVTCLAIGWLLFPEALLAAGDHESTGGASVLILAQRTAALYAGLAVIGFLARAVPPSPARRAIAVGTAVLCGGLALSGLLCFALGLTGWGGLTTAVFEILVGVAYVIADRTDIPDAARAASRAVVRRSATAGPEWAMRGAALAPSIRWPV